MATKKQVNDLENVVIVLEERLEKMEEDHAMLKQMLSMQNVLIENLQMMVKMMSVTPSQLSTVGYKVMHIGGGVDTNANADTETAPPSSPVSGGSEATEDISRVSSLLSEKDKKNSISDMKRRMSRIV